MRGAVDLDRSLVGLHHPAENLHQRRLARAVLADQRENLAPVHRQADTGKGADAGIALGDVDQPEEGIGQIRSLRKTGAAHKRSAPNRKSSERRIRVRSPALFLALALFQLSPEGVDVVLADDLGRDDDQAVLRNEGLVSFEILGHVLHALVAPFVGLLDDG